MNKLEKNSYFNKKIIKVSSHVSLNFLNSKSSERTY